jgi:hypothetical protein
MPVPWPFRRQPGRGRAPQCAGHWHTSVADKPTFQPTHRRRPRRRQRIRVLARRRRGRGPLGRSTHQRPSSTAPTPTRIITSARPDGRGGVPTYRADWPLRARQDCDAGPEDGATTALPAAASAERTPAQVLPLGWTGRADHVPFSPGPSPTTCRFSTPHRQRPGRTLNWYQTPRSPHSPYGHPGHHPSVRTPAIVVPRRDCRLPAVRQALHPPVETRRAARGEEAVAPLGCSYVILTLS